MKKIIFILMMAISTNVFAEERTGVRAEYDDTMKSAGKWGFISNFMYLSAFLSAGGAYYSSTRADKYKDIKKQRLLTEHEQSELDTWNKITKAGAYTAGGTLIFGLIGTGMSIQYENNAHKFALDMNVHF